MSLIGQVGQNRSFFVNMVQIGSFLHNLGAKCRHMSKFWESGPIILSLKVSKNYFSQVYGQKCGKNVINGVNFVKIGHF